MSEHSNFTMTPNIAFELLDNPHDLVGYQKLIRLVGIGGTWSGGNKALAEKIGQAYGRIIKLKNKLKEVGFIEVKDGDFGHGEADEWTLVNIWKLNDAEATPSPNEHTPSLNEQGQNTDISDENQSNAENIGVQPHHETDKPPSRNEQATPSPNEQHNKIFKEEVVKKEDFSFSRASQKFRDDFLNGLKTRMKLAELPAKETYDEAAQWLFVNKFTAERALLCYDTLVREQIHPKHWRKKGRISAKNITENISVLDDLINQLDEWDNEKTEEKPTNGTNRRNLSAADKRSQSAIDEYNATEQLRIDAEKRRRKPPGNDAAGRG